MLYINLIATSLKVITSYINKKTWELTLVLVCKKGVVQSLSSLMTNVIS